MNKKWAIISLLNGEEEIIQADDAELDEKNNVVIFYLNKTEEEIDKNRLAPPYEIVAMYNMEMLIGWSFDDTGYYDDIEDEEDYCMECSAEAYSEGIKDCWNFFNKMLLDVIEDSKLRSELKCFFRNNEPIEIILEHLRDEDDEI